MATKETELTYAQAAPLLGVSTREGVKHLVKIGKLRPVQRGGRNYLRQSDVATVAAERGQRAPRGTKVEQQSERAARTEEAKSLREKKRAERDALAEWNEYERIRERVQAETNAATERRREREAADESATARVEREVSAALGAYEAAGVTLTEAVALLGCVGVSTSADFRELVRRGEVRLTPKPQAPELPSVSALGVYSLARMQQDSQCDRVKRVETRYMRDDVLAYRERLEGQRREAEEAKEEEPDLLTGLLKLVGLGAGVTAGGLAATKALSTPAAQAFLNTAGQRFVETLKARDAARLEARRDLPEE